MAVNHCIIYSGSWNIPSILFGLLSLVIPLYYNIICQNGKKWPAHTHEHRYLAAGRHQQHVTKGWHVLYGKWGNIQKGRDYDHRTRNTTCVSVLPWRWRSRWCSHHRHRKRIFHIRGQQAHHGIFITSIHAPTLDVVKKLESHILSSEPLLLILHLLLLLSPPNWDSFRITIQ